MANEALQHIAQLYAIETTVRGAAVEMRLHARQQHSVPILQDLHGWCLNTLKQVSKKSEIASPIHYTLSRWEALTRYANDGSIEIDNNAAERAKTPYRDGTIHVYFNPLDFQARLAALVPKSRGEPDPLPRCSRPTAS